MWRIVADFNTSFYWSNAWGWVDEQSADSFTIDERATLALPIGGHWVWDENMEWKRKSRARSFIAECSA